MIRFADHNDTAAVRALWDVCFGEDASFNDWFFANRYKPEETLLSLDDEGKLMAMTQMMPYPYTDADGTAEVTYIYGACTAPEYRKQGLMAQLLRRSFAIDRERGRIGSVLIPAEPWLFDFYQKYGYETAFSVSEQELVHNGNTADVQNLRTAEASDIPSMDACYRRQAGVPRLERTEAEWAMQMRMFRELGGEVYVAGTDGVTDYAFVWRGESELTVQEVVGEHREAFLQSILRKNGRQTMKYTTVGEEKRLGVLCRHTNRPIEMGYFNLLYN